MQPELDGLFHRSDRHALRATGTSMKGHNIRAIAVVAHLLGHRQRSAVPDVIARAVVRIVLCRLHRAMWRGSPSCSKHALANPAISAKPQTASVTRTLRRIERRCGKAGIDQGL